MLAIVGALALVAFAGAALTAVLVPKIALSIGLAFFVIGVWWENARTVLQVARNFAFIFASSLMLLGGIVALSFGIMGLAPLTYWASQYQLDRESLTYSSLSAVLFLWGTGETILKGCKNVAKKKTANRSWLEALLETLF